jgi:heat shock protein HslJ
MTAETEFFNALDKGVTVASTADGVTLTTEQGTVFTLTEGGAIITSRQSKNPR